MAIYTRSGDKGTTALFGGKRVLKHDTQVDAYGSVDELSSFLGMIEVKSTEESEQQYIQNIQMDLYTIMSVLSGYKEELSHFQKRVLEFEQKIDEIEKGLPELRQFILPGGTELAAWYHITRTVCRRSERNVIKYFQSVSVEHQSTNFIVMYLNRLSDLLFVLGRWYNKNNEVIVKKL